ncbi:sel1 repeat family protein, partial [Achromobacter ruhlandii]
MRHLPTAWLCVALAGGLPPAVMAQASPRPVPAANAADSATARAALDAVTHAQWVAMHNDMLARLANAAPLADYRALAESGNARAQALLGFIYASEHSLVAGLAQDLPQAAGWFRRAVAQGDVPAHVGLGLLTLHGMGAARDDAEAARLFRYAADRGSSAGQANLGDLHIEGRGVPQDPAAAASLYRLAAEQGHMNAQTNLAVLYARGWGVRQDYAEALRLYRLAAAPGGTQAYVGLGDLYRTGGGARRASAAGGRR